MAHVLHEKQLYKPQKNKEKNLFIFCYWRFDRPVEQYDDYGYEDEGEEYEEEEEYLELRRLLKEKKRREMKMKEGGSRANFNDRKKLLYDNLLRARVLSVVIFMDNFMILPSFSVLEENFGSFFGPFRPVIAERVIQESNSLLETQHLVSRVKDLSVHPVCTAYLSSTYMPFDLPFS